MPEGGAYWQKVGLEAILILDYAGDGVANREIPLGDVYDEVEVMGLDNFGASGNGVFLARAVWEGHNLLCLINNVHKMYGGTNADTLWRGFNPARDRLLLGTTAGLGSTNQNTRPFRVRAKKFRSVRS